MDPQQALSELLDMLVEADEVDREEIISKLDGLRQWISGGGFLPTVHGYPGTHDRVYEIGK